MDKIRDYIVTCEVIDGPAEDIGETYYFEIAAFDSAHARSQAISTARDDYGHKVTTRVRLESATHSAPPA